MGSTASAQTPACATGAAVPDAANNPGLVADCTALLAAKDVLEGANIASRDRLNWSTARAITAWTGVSLSGAPPRVTAIDLTERRLTGTIPPGLRDLSQLWSLNLQRNRLSGTIPLELGGLARLEELALSQNRLTGAIPPQLGNLAALERLYLHSNRLSGAIPPELRNLAQLELLSLTANQLTGAIPAELADLSELRELYLYQNRLTGQIPPQLGNLPHLTELRLAQNRFTGCLPRQLADVESNDFADLTLEECGPLSLTLTAERAQCTAATRTPVTWEITGGVPPYTLTVGGETVDADAEDVTVTCGTLPEPAEGQDPVTEAPGTIPASVTDTAGEAATARAAYTIVPPLPAPTGATSYPAHTAIALRWDRVPGAGPTPTPASECPCPLYLVRWRPTGTEPWTTIVHVDLYSNLPGAGFYRDGFLAGTTYEFVVAALRGAIEQETSAALVWSAPVTATTLAPPRGVQATATHDTITVTWDPQPAAGRYSIGVTGPSGSTFQRFTPDGDATHQVVFRHLPPETEYTVDVAVEVGFPPPVTEITVRTAAVPAGWTPLARGPQNLHTSVTHNSVTVDWDPPHAGASDGYHVFLDPPAGLTQSVTVHSGVTSHTFMGLAPATTYEVFVSHADIVVGDASATVTTAPAPVAGQRTGPVTACFEIFPGSSICLTPAPTPVGFHWPLEHDDTEGSADCPARDEALRHTDDIWVLRPSGRFHAGLDVSHECGSGRVAGRAVYAAAAGRARAFNVAANNEWIMYCPGIGGSLHTRFITNSQPFYNNAQHGACNYVVSPYSGRTVLIFHTDGKTVTKYAHLQRPGNAADRAALPAGMDTPTGTPVEVGALIGRVGRTSLFNEDTDPDNDVYEHLHFEIRDVGDTPTEWNSPTKGWYSRDSRFVKCGSESGYCTWREDPARRMVSVLDPEALLPVLPASRWPTRPELDHNPDPDEVDRERRAFELISVTPPEAGTTVSLELSVGIWRPPFYHRNRVAAPERKFLPGVAGTRDGVTGYRVVASSSCLAGTSMSADGGNPTTRTYVNTTDTDGGGAEGETPRVRIQQPVRVGTPCTFAVYSLNDSYLRGYAGPEVHGPAAEFRLLGALAGIGTLPNATLANFDHHIYPFEVVGDQWYQFNANTLSAPQVPGVSPRDGVLRIQIWQGENLVTQAVGASPSLGWLAPEEAEGAHYLLVRGGVPNNAPAAEGAYTLEYSVPLVPPTGLQTSDLTSSSVTVRYELPAGVSTSQVRLGSSGRPTAPNGGSSGASGSGAADSPVLSHEFTGLSPETTYELYVRSTGPNRAFSDWASVSVTTCPSSQPATTRTVTTTGATRWTYPVDGMTSGELETTRQPQRRTVVCDGSTGTWDTGSWQDDGDATTTWESTGTTMTAPAMPPVMRLVAVSETRNAASGCGDTERRMGSRKDNRTVTWNAIPMTWSEGVWVLGVPVWGAWVLTEGPRPAQPAATRTVTSYGATRWTYPSNGSSGGTTYEEQLVTRQPQSRTISWDASTCEWDPGPWQNAGTATSSWERTSNSKTVGAEPATTLPVNLSQTRNAASGCGDTESRTGTRTDTRTVGWNSATGNWNTPGAWILGTPVWGGWVLTQGTRPVRPSASQTITQSEKRWVVGATAATEQGRTREQVQIRSVTWSGKPDCEWDTTAWVNFGTATWSAWTTLQVVPKPPLPPNVEQVPVGPPETRWVTDPNIPFCILWEEQRQLYRTTIYGNQSWVWSAKNWVLRRTLLFQGNTYSAWTRTGNTQACPRGTQDDGAQSAAENVTLAAGDYTLPWGLQRISFTVPAGVEVQLSLRTLESGVQAVVLSSAAGAELVLYPGALADGARPSPSVADTTLSSIAATLALTTVELVAPSPPEDEECAVVTAAVSGATAVDLDASLCAIVPTGELSVTLGGQTLSLTLPTGYNWLLLRVSPDPAVLGVIDTASGAYLALNAATGAEESREVGEDVAATIGPIFDAIVTSVQPPAAEDDSS